MSTDSRSVRVPVPVPVRVRHRKRGVLYWAWIPIVVFIAGLAWIVSNELQASRKVASELEKLQIQGMPVDNPSFQALYEKQTYREGTNSWLEIGRTVEGAIASGTDLPLIGNGKVPDADQSLLEWNDEPRVRAYLDEMKPLLGRIHEATQYPKPVWYPMQFHGENTLLPQYSDSRGISRLLELDTLHAIKSGESDRALQDMRSLLAVSEVWDEDLLLVTQFAQFGMRNQYLSSIRYSLAQGSLWNMEQMVELQGQIQELKRGEETWRHCLQGERYVMLASIDAPDASSNAPLSRFLLPSGKLRLLEAYQGLEDLVQGGLDNLYRRRFVQHSVHAILRSSTRSFDGSHLVLGRIFPAVEGFAQGLFVEEQHRRLVLTALGVKRFRLQEGRWPNNLEELTTVGCNQEDWTIPQNLSFGYKIQSETEIVLSGFDGVRTPYFTEGALNEHESPDDWDRWWIVRVRQ